MNRIIKSFLVVAWVVLAASCQKKDTTPVDLSKVSVTFTNPKAGEIFHKGDTLRITAEVAYISEINGIGIQIIDTATGTVLLEEDHDLHMDHFTLPAEWADTLSESATLQVKVTVFVANSTMPAERSAYFVTTP
jgi:hypothetical protein